MEQLLLDIDAFCERHEWSATRFGEEAMKDRAFVHQLRNKGRDPQYSTVVRVRAFIADKDAERSAKLAKLQALGQEADAA